MSIVDWLLDRLGDLAALLLPEEDPGDLTVARHPATPGPHVRVFRMPE